MNTITVRARVTKAEVYRSGCTVHMSAHAVFAEGSNRIVVEGLPDGLDEESVSLRMPNQITQSQVRVVRDTQSDKKPEELSQLDDQIDDLDRRIQNRELELNTWRGLTERVAGASGLDYLKMLPDMLDSLSKDLVELRTQRKRLALKRDKRRNWQARPRLEADVICSQEQTLPLIVSCRSNKAGWRSSYDVLVDQIGEPLKLRQHGEVWQETGDDWNAVSLTLSTGSATLAGDLPRFFPRYLCKEQTFGSRMRGGSRPHPMMVQAKASAPSMSFGSLSADDTIVPGDTGRWNPSDFGEVVEPEASVSEQATVTTYDITERQSIASGGDSLRLVVGTTELAARYYYYAYPRKEEAVYLVARLENEPSPEMLGLPLAVYLEGSYAGSIRVGRAYDMEGYELALGRDERVCVRRKESIERSRKLIGNKQAIVHNVEIDVQNHKSDTINIDVLEQVPISQDKEIEVSLHEGSTADFDKDRGELRWQRSVHTGSGVRLEASYVISHARGLVVAERERR